MNELIIVKQLPIIEESLMALKTEIEAKTNIAANLVVTEETVKDVKSIRAELNKEFSELEEQRKIVKSKILAPYEDFEKIYKECVSDAYKTADNTLKSKINEVEDSLKQKKEEQLVNYFNECVLSKGLGFLTYDKVGVNMTLSASMKSLQEQIQTFVDKVVDDLALIKTQEHSDEILVEYKNSLNVSQSIQMVIDRKKALEEIKPKEQPAETVSNEPLQEVVSIKTRKYYAVYKVTGTEVELKSLSAFLKNNGISYEVEEQGEL